MGQRFQELSESHIQFISEQKIFFVGTATETSRVNVSPKGMDTFAVLDSKRIAWLNVTGSGNETSAHIQNNPRMTIMFCAFEGKPLVLRLYGRAMVVHRSDPEWDELIRLFKPFPGARQIFSVAVDLVQSSCGMSIPYFDYVGERELLNDWATRKGEDGMRQYWATKNQESIDAIPTNIVAKSG
ncbi:MAG TPA: pyridoxamine 5'-phosphate oxidase family protein [Acidisarcina sp.]|nr:pyridoxamine 5'-phosphate oxidase family protein [Acidisarcina sp.]